MAAPFITPVAPLIVGDVLAQIFWIFSLRVTPISLSSSICRALKGLLFFFGLVSRGRIQLL